MKYIEIMNAEENHFLLSQEAFRDAKAYPYLWTQYKIDGKVDKSKMRLPIRFKLT